MKNYILFFTLIINFYLKSNLVIYDFFPEELNCKTYDGYAHLEECKSYELLNNIKQNLNGNYFAIPWSYYFTNQSYKQKTDALIRQQKKVVFNGFTVAYDYRIFKFTNQLKKMGIYYVFTPQTSKAKYKINGVKFMPIPHVARNFDKSYSNKDILYSFIGSLNCKTRKQIIKLLKNKPNTIVQSSSRFHYHKQEKDRQKSEQNFREILARSRYSLCPRGSHPGSIRFWESLASGAIPVVISDQIILPENFDWTKCAIFVPEKDINKIDSIIRNIPPKKELLLRKNCITAYSMFSDNNYISPIVHFLNKKTRKNYSFDNATNLNIDVNTYITLNSIIKIKSLY